MAGSQENRQITISPLTTERQFRDVVSLQETIWGFKDIELLPVRFFAVVTRVGGQLLGAFDGDRMIAFCLAIPALKPGGRSYLHSQMLGVLSEYRDRGIGRMLKLRQRDDALERGIDLVEWTFDPLELKNAWFNIERLGAIIRRYVRNQYGTTTSHLHGGLPTDRCTAEWWVNSERVRNTLNGIRDMSKPIAATIRVPSAIPPDDRRAIQAGLADQLEAAFNRGLIVTGMERTLDWSAYQFVEAE